MIKAEFSFKNNQIFIMCNEDDKMEEICKRFGIKAGTDLKNLVFLYGGIIQYFQFYYKFFKNFKN